MIISRSDRPLRAEMDLQDLEIAKRRLSGETLTLCIVKDNKIIFETYSHGISGFLAAIDKIGIKLKQASVADRTAGKAIALLCVYAKIKAVYAITLSRKGKELLEENGVYHEWSCLVENILDANKMGICPFEKLATEISSPSDAYERLKALQHSLRCSSK
ncbi:MAG TPA: DUF1893 domain-containing protein [Candidatus Bathyarchaeia archaeon]